MTLLARPSPRTTTRRSALACGGPCKVRSVRPMANEPGSHSKRKLIGRCPHHSAGYRPDLRRPPLPLPRWWRHGPGARNTSELAAATHARGGTQSRRIKLGVATADRHRVPPRVVYGHSGAWRYRSGAGNLCAVRMPASLLIVVLALGACSGDHNTSASQPSGSAKGSTTPVQPSNPPRVEPSPRIAHVRGRAEGRAPCAPAGPAKFIATIQRPQGAPTQAYGAFRTESAGRFAEPITQVCPARSSTFVAPTTARRGPSPPSTPSKSVCLRTTRATSSMLRSTLRRSAACSCMVPLVGSTRSTAPPTEEERGGSCAQTRRWAFNRPGVAYQCGLLSQARRHLALRPRRFLPVCLLRRPLRTLGCVARSPIAGRRLRTALPRLKRRHGERSSLKLARHDPINGKGPVDTARTGVPAAGRPQRRLKCGATNFAVRCRARPVRAKRDEQAGSGRLLAPSSRCSFRAGLGGRVSGGSMGGQRVEHLCDRRVDGSTREG